MTALPYLIAYALPVSFFAGLALGGPWVLLPVAVAFGLIPALDPLFGHDDADAPEGSQTVVFDALIRAWVPVQTLVLGAGLWWIAATEPTLAEAIGLTLSAGVVTGGGGITIGHELMHRRSTLDRGLAEVLLTQVSYTHFCVEHVHGHHKHVSTPLDPASSRLGESVFAFWPRTVFGGLRSAWHLESARVAKRQLRGLRDRRVRYAIVLGAAYVGIGLAAGWAGLAFFAAQSLVAITLLEVVNYVEHYGLSRAELSPGRYERVQPHHSWNATHRLTNWFLFNLPRHADHHAWAFRPYRELRAWPDAPALPFGYPTMVILALVPPLWFRIMNPRVAAVRQAASEAA